MRYLLSFILLLAGCWSTSGPNVVVYTAQDIEFAKPVFDDFERETGIKVLAKPDVESTKSLGLVEEIVSERDRPRCDIFWNNEILHTLRLARHDELVEAYISPVAKNYPAQYRPADGLWHGLAARARVLLVNTKVVPKADRPHSILDMADGKWQGKIGLAKPLFGTTATHAACLFAVWGSERAEGFFDRLKANQVKICAGNRAVAREVGSGNLAFGLTDTDDAMAEIDAASPVVIVYPDQAKDEMGTLFIPNTLVLIKGCPHPTEARRLIDYLLAPPVETRLATGPSAQIPLNTEVKVKSRLDMPKNIRAMEIDFEAAVDQWKIAYEYLKQFGDE